MNEFDAFVKAANAAGTSYSERAVNSFAQAYNKNTTEWFSKAHGIDDARNYNQSDYHRVAFKSHSDAHRFMADMQAQGIDVVATPFKINGQYVAEIKQTQADGKNADSIISDFSQRCFVTPQEVQQPSMASDTSRQANQAFGASIFSSIVLNNLGTAGEFVHIMDRLASVSGTNQYGNTSNSDIFNSRIGANGEANPTVNAGLSKTATVYGGNTVVMDGKIVTDEAIVNNVLAQHKERMEQADSILGYDKMADYVNKQLDTYDKLNQRVQDGYDLSEKQAERLQRATEIRNSVIDDMGISLGAGERVTSSQIGDFNKSVFDNAESNGFHLKTLSGGFDSEAWNNRASSAAFSSLGLSEAGQSLFHSLNENFGKLSVEQANAQAIRNAAYNQEYAVTTAKGNVDTLKESGGIFAHWEKGVLDDLSNKLNSENIASKMLGDEKILTLSESDRASFDNMIESYNARNPENMVSYSNFLDSNGNGVAGSFVTSEIALQKLENCNDALKEQINAELKAKGYKVSELSNDDVAKIISQNIASKKATELINNNNSISKYLDSKGKKFEDILKANNGNSLLAIKQLKDELLALPENLRPQKVLNELNKIEKNALKNQYKFEEQLKFSDKEKKLVENAKNAFVLSEQEKAMLTGNSKLLNDLKKSSWISDKNLLKGSMTPEKLLNINADFLRNAGKQGFNFIKANGKFDIKMLKNLSAADLAKLGITDNVRNMLVGINQKGSFGMVSNSGKMLGSLASGMGFFIRKIDGGEGWSDISELYQYTRKGISYAKSVSTNIKRLTDTRLNDLRKLRANGIDRMNKSYSGNVKPKNPRAKEGIQKPLSERQLKKQQKYGEKLQKKLKKVEKKQNSLLSKFSKKIDLVKKKLAESALGKAFAAVSKAMSSFFATFALYYFGFGAIGAFFIQIAALIAVLVIALVDMLAGIFNIGNWFAPQTYKDTVAYNLYNALTKQENMWVETLANTPQKAYEQRNQLKYGFFGEDLETYLANRAFDNIYYYDGDMWINPFWKIGNEDERFMTSLVGGYDGKHTYDISTNLNYYSLISVVGEEDENGVLCTTSSPQYGTSNGHTSNIKDIIAMTDVMYQMEATDSDDGSLVSVMGMSTAQLDIQAAGNWLDETFKAIGDFFANLWSDLFGDGSHSYSEIEVNSISYRTVHNYAFNLFEMSHQNYFYFDVEYYDTKKKLLNADGTEVEFINGSEEFGICPNPYLGQFELSQRMDENVPVPSIGDFLLDEVDEDGNPVNGDIIITMEDEKEGDEAHNCLWDGYVHGEGRTSDGSYCERVREQLGRCWSEPNPPQYEYKYVEASATYSVSVTTYSVTVDGKQVHGGTNTTKQSDAATASREANAAARAAAEGTPIEDDWYLYPNDKSCIWHHFERIYEKVSETTTSTSNTTQSSSSQSQSAGEGKTVTVTTSSTTVTTTYTVTVKAKYQKETIHSYARNCRGTHGFWYCGGHITTHNQGNVFSVTNEQMALTEIYEEGYEPLALFENGFTTPYTNKLMQNKEHLDKYSFDTDFPKLQGKVVRKDIDYSTAETASKTGGSISGSVPTPVEDIYQGTAVSQGLNVIVNSDKSWGTGVAVETERDFLKPEGCDDSNLYLGIEVVPQMVQYCRDIFDCDCVILKGKNILPYRDIKKYEGWTADNMLLVCNRLGMNWYETYGFEINTEIGKYNYALSEMDIDMIIIGLKAEYGSAFTDDKEIAMRRLLSKVGRGHYTGNLHSGDTNGNGLGKFDPTANHGFLSHTCTSRTTLVVRNGLSETVKQFECSCSAGNSADLASYVRNILCKINNKMSIVQLYKPEYFNNSIIAVSSTNQLSPLDFVVHKDYQPENNSYTLDVNTTAPIEGSLLKNFHCKGQQVVYVGTFKYSSIQAMKDYLHKKITDDDVYNQYFDELCPYQHIRLSNGLYIYAEYPVCIDLTQQGVYSGLLLRSEGDLTMCGTSDENFTNFLSRYHTGEISASDVDEIAKTQIAQTTTYYWLLNPDARTYKTGSSYLS